MLGTIVGMIMVSMPVPAPLITIHDPTSPNLLMRLNDPSADYWIGTDHLGRDLWSRLLYGGRFSVTIAAITLLLSAVIGTLIGTCCGCVGGVVDEVAMQVVDLLLSFPEIIVALFLIAIIGPGYGTLVLSLTVFGWTPFARLARGLALELIACETLFRTRFGRLRRWRFCASDTS